jgi:cytochrome P450
MLLPAFHGEAIGRYEALIAEVAAAEVESWPVGETIATRPRMQAITLEVILHAVIGVRDEQRLARLRQALSQVARAGLFAFRAEAAYPGLPTSALGRRLPWIRARHEADKLLYEEIADHRADPAAREDILSLLIAAEGEQQPLTDQELRDQLITLLVAGQETTAAVLAWCFERLVRHPDVLTRARDELAGENAGRYLEAVVNETLRVRPVIDMAARKLAAPLQLGGHLLPAGTIVTASINGVQQSNAFENPTEFRPERFLDQPAAPYTLIPFGGGTHRCIGASFAVMEAQTILRVALERVQIKAPTTRDERPVRWRRITTTPAHDGSVTITASTRATQPRRGELQSRPSRRGAGR